MKEVKFNMQTSTTDNWFANNRYWFIISPLTPLRCCTNITQNCHKGTRSQGVNFCIREPSENWFFDQVRKKRRWLDLRWYTSSFSFLASSLNLRRTEFNPKFWRKVATSNAHTKVTKLLIKRKTSDSRLPLHNPTPVKNPSKIPYKPLQTTREIIWTTRRYQQAYHTES